MRKLRIRIFQILWGWEGDEEKWLEIVDYCSEEYSEVWGSPDEPWYPKSFNEGLLWPTGMRGSKRTCFGGFEPDSGRTGNPGPDTELWRNQR